MRPRRRVNCCPPDARLSPQKKERELFKNSLKILMSKFPKVWSILLYYIIASAIIGALSVTVLIPLINSFREAGLGAQLIELFDKMFAGTLGGIQGFFSGLADIFNIFSANVLNSAAVWGSLWIFVFVIVVVARFAFGLIEYPITVIIDGHMSSKVSYSVTGKFLLHSGRSSLFQLSKMLFSIPADLVIWGGLYGISFLFGVDGVRFFTPLIMIAWFLFAVPLKMQLFSCWAPGLVSDKKKMFPAFFSGLKIAFGKGRGMKIYSAYFATVFLTFTLALFFGIFTLGVGLLILAPAAVLFANVLNTVIYYSYNGKRYYADAETVITTPKVEEN
jgi:hypothetical protein